MAIKIAANGRPAFQGDVSVRSVEQLPAGAVQQAKGDVVVVAHSETGHDHVATGKFDVFEVPGDPMRMFLVARAGVTIEHRRSFDTHETFQLDSGGSEVIWEIGRQREWAPEGWRRVED